MTGYSHERAVPHEERVAALLSILQERGYRPLALASDGDRPDVRITDPKRGTAYIDVKVPQPNQLRYSIKIGALAEFRRIETVEHAAVYVVWADNNVDTPDTLAARIVGGPRRATGNGSATDWLLVERGGTPFNEFFPVAA